MLDMIIHYRLKLEEIESRMDDIRAHMERCESLVETSWKGESGTAFRIKLEEMMMEAEKLKVAAEDAKELLTNVETRRI